MRTIFYIATLAICIAVAGLWTCSRSRNCSCSQSRKGLAYAEKPFCIIVPSYNNSAFVEKNLTSIYSQKYQNFRVVYIDDNSTDATYVQAKAIIENLNQEKRTTLLHNSTNIGALANLYKAVHSCSDDEIAVLVDGDDFLAHEEVLKVLNQTYADPEVWMTYGSYLDYPSFNKEETFSKPIPRRIIEKKSYRSHPWSSSHLRTFYAPLFKQVKISDLFYRGGFFSMGWDLAFMLPMLEMAGHHARYIPDILYLYNRKNPISDHKINHEMQAECATEIRKRKPYPTLAGLQTSAFHEKADLLIFSYNRPLQLQALLESIDEMMTGIDRLIVLYRQDPAFKPAYDELLVRFPKVTWIAQSAPSEDFQPLCNQAVFAEGSSPYILFAVDDMIVKDTVDLKECIRALEDTKAYGFYLAHSLTLDRCYMMDRYQGIPPYIQLADSIYAWQFSAGNDDWAYPNSLDLVLYRKADILKDFKKIDFSNPFSLESKWNLRAKKDRVGLFFTSSKAINLPLNLVITSQNAHSKSYSTEELLQKFNEGLKIDWTPFKQIENHSRHIDSEISFIKSSESPKLAS